MAPDPPYLPPPAPQALLSSEPPSHDSHMVANGAKVPERGNIAPEGSRGVRVAIQKLVTRFRSCFLFGRENTVKKKQKGEDEDLCLWRRKIFAQIKYVGFEPWTSGT